MNNNELDSQAGSGDGRPRTDVQAVDAFRAAADKVRAELRKVIVGQDDAVEQMLIAFFAGGHCILEGVPGLAKTLMISTLAQCLDLTFSRIQFTPDLMPSDITGTEVIQEDRASGTRSFKFLQGPIFANVVLADEINRTPPKTQAALLEAMQERQVTVGRERYVLEAPFFVLATQNPIEQEGTYPLPEAQQDRFLFKIKIGYPSYDEELAIAEQTTTDRTVKLERVISGADCLAYQKLARRIPAARDVVAYALNIVRSSRPSEPDSSEFVKSMITWGAGPRAVQALLLGGKVRAALQGRHHVSVDDVRSLCHPVLRHRIVTNFSAEAEGYTTDRVVDELLEAIDPNRTDVDGDPRISKVLSA